ncbi:cupin [Amycolatopsis sp. NPDC051373]|uniref:cupin n=1 Tax=Amycolatopsis sp. NPDC051373 TaxID=3155801 RepID=UPI00344F1646
MTLLTVWPDDQPGHVLLRTEDPGTITAELARIGIEFGRWPVDGPLPGASESEVLARFQDRIDSRTTAVGYHAVDVLTGDFGAAERSLPRDEDRFFVTGSAVWYLHAGRQVHAVLGEPGDLLGIPAHTRHWHDGGSNPGHVTIRVRHPASGSRTPSAEPLRATGFPGFDELVAGRASTWPALSH